MYLVVIAWLYVVLMMAVAEATHSNGTLLGAILTFFFYGLAPTALVVYLMGTPLRRKALRAQEAAEMATRAQAENEPTPQDSSGEAPASGRPPSHSSQPDTGSHAPGGLAEGNTSAVGKPR